MLQGILIRLGLIGLVAREQAKTDRELTLMDEVQLRFKFMLIAGAIGAVVLILMIIYGAISEV